MISTVATALLVVSGLVTAGSVAVCAVVLYRRFSMDDPPGVWRKRVDRYDELMATVIRINRLSVELSESDEYKIQQEKYTMGQESEYDELMSELVRTNQQSFFLIDTEVKDAVTEYINYMSRIHERGPNLETQMRLSGEIIKRMRGDLDLDPVYTDRVADRSTDE